MSFFCKVWYIFIVLYYVWSVNASYNEFNIKAFDGHTELYESQILPKLKATKDFLASEKQKGLEAGALTAASTVPYIGLIADLTSALTSVLEESSISTLLKAIEDARQQALAEEGLRNMKSLMRTAQTNINLVKNKHEDFTNVSVVQMVHSIHRDVDLMVNRFDAIDSIFRKYSLVAAPVLIALAPFIAVFVELANAYVPGLTKNTCISCTYYDILLEYRELVIRERLAKVTCKF